MPSFDHVVVIVFENKDESQVIGSRDAPTFTQLGHRYVRLTRYTAITHPSLPNYLALISGSTTTSKPAVASRATASGTSATRRSPGSSSRGTPMRTSRVYVA